MRNYNIYCLDKRTHKNPVLSNTLPDKTFYISFDITEKPNPNYHHDSYYSYKDMETIQKEQQSIQINNITFKVTITISLKFIFLSNFNYLSNYKTLYKPPKWFSQFVICIVVNQFSNTD